jgi:hypothetical protein
VIPLRSIGVIQTGLRLQRYLSGKGDQIMPYDFGGHWGDARPKPLSAFLDPDKIQHLKRMAELEAKQRGSRFTVTRVSPELTITTPESNTIEDSIQHNYRPIDTGGTPSGVEAVPR